MDLNLGLIIAQIINFGILFYIFKRFLGDALIKTIKERKEDLSKLENASDDVKSRIDEANVKAEVILRKARKKAGDIEKNSESMAKQNKEQIINTANQEAKSIIAGAKDDIEKERQSMMNSMKNKVVLLSLKLNEKLFEKERVNKDFMEKKINSINI